MRLPDAFIAEMAELWQLYQPGGTLADFLDAHQGQPMSGLRANLLKLTAAELLHMMPSTTFDPVPWSPTGFYTAADLNPGRLPFYHAGLYYIQEPSAMLPAEVLAARSGDKVLDLCAAPGGKSSRLATMIGKDGLLWSNEISGERVKALLRNLELMGVDRLVITQETPERLAARLPEFFDRILVDAPCSGSGMFRRDPSAISSWERDRFGPTACAAVQRDILESADLMLKQGGYLVYSTCSFSVIEDELMIAGFMQNHPDYQICPIDPKPGISPGLAITPDLQQTARIWPHLTSGDGHFCALLQKAGRSDFTAATPTFAPVKGPADRVDGSAGGLSTDQARDFFQQWADQVFSESGLQLLREREELAYYRLHQDQLHLVPDVAPQLHGLKLVKTGLYLGQFRMTGSRLPRTQTTKKSRPTAPSFIFEPAHAMLLTMHAADLRLALRLKADDPTLLRYLRGETIEWPAASLPQSEWPSGAWVAVCLEDYPLGWARTSSPGLLKNLYPPAWRKMN